MGKKIVTISIHPWNRKDYPGWKSKSELKKEHLMPSPNAKPRAVVMRDNSYGGPYLLYDETKTVPYRVTQKMKKEREFRRKEYTCKICGQHVNERKAKSRYDTTWVSSLHMCSRCYMKQFTGYKNVIVYDTETTGLNPESDELLSLSIIDLEGNVLFYKYFKPENIAEWPAAEIINGISPEDVSNENPARMYVDEIQKIFNGADLLVTYNGMGFDDFFLRAIGVHIPDVKKCDVMLEYAKIIGERDHNHDGWKWHKLIDCAGNYGYWYDAHDALEDARATLWCFKKMTTADNDG